MVFGIIATIIAVASAAASYVQQKKAKKAAAKQAQELASVQIAGHDSNRSLYTIYGETLVGSTTVWKKVSDKRIGWSASGFDIFSQATGTELTQTNDTDSNRFLYRVVALGAGPIEGVTNIIIDGESYNSSRFAQRDSRLHFASAVSDGPVAGRFFTPFNTYSQFANWNSAMTGKAVAYAVERLYLHKKSPAFQGEPSTQYVVKGRKVYDPRKDSTASQYDATLGVSTHRSNDSATWQWSDNPSICLLDYLVNDEYGRGLDYSDIDLDSIASAADKCDDGVSIPARLTNDTGAVVTVADPFTGLSYTINIGAEYDQYRSDQDAGNTQKRFRLNMAVDGANEVLDNVQSILNTFRGHLVYANGKYIVQMDDVESSSLSLNDDDIIGGLKISEGDRSQRMNRCTIKFNNKNKQYKTDQVSWPEIGTTEYNTYLAEDQDEKLHKTFTIEGCNDFYQAEDTAEFLVRDSRVTQTVRGKFGPRALGLVPGDVISLTYDSAGFSGKFFRVRSVGLDISTHEVSLELVEYDSSVYTWNANKGNEPLGISWVEDPFNLEPTAPTIGTITEGVITRADGSTTITMAIPYTDVPEDADSLEVSYKVSTASVYQTVQVLEPEDQTSQTVVVDTDDATYDVRIRYFVTNNNGRTFPSAYDTTTFTVSALTGTALDNFQAGSGVNTFVQASTSVPTALAAGDIWYTTDTGKQYIATNAGDNQIVSGEWEIVLVVADEIDNQGDLATEDSVDYTTGQVTNTPTSLTDINANEYGIVNSIQGVPVTIPAGNTQTVTQVGLDIQSSGNESTGNWSTQFYSITGSNACGVVWTVGSTTSRYMIGLNSDPTFNASYNSIDYAWYVRGTTAGDYNIYENGTLVQSVGTNGSYSSITAGDILIVGWDGTTIRYFHNGTLVREVVPSSPASAYFLDSSIDGIGSQHTTVIKNISFIVSGSTKPQLNRDVLAEDGTTVLADEDLRNSALDVSTSGATLSVTYGGNTSTGITLDAASNIDNALYYTAGATEYTGETDATHNTILAAAASDPTGQEGEFYYNTTDKEWKYYNGTAWVAVSTFNTGALADKDNVDLGTGDVTGTLGTGNADSGLINTNVALANSGSTLSLTGGNAATVTLDAASNIDNALAYTGGATYTGETDATHNTILPAAASDPTGQTGEFYYNTTDNEWKYYNGTAWVAVSTFNTGALADKDNVDLGTGDVTGTLGTGNADSGLINTNVTLSNSGSTLSLTGGNAATVTLDASIVDNALAYSGGGTYTGALNAEVNTVNAGDNVNVFTNALAYSGGGTYTGDLAATLGADWNDNISGQPYDSQVLSEKVVEAFDYPTSAAIGDTPWVSYQGVGEFSIVQSAAVSGGKVLRVGNNSGNDERWMISNTQIPYDPSRMYRITVRARKTAGSGLAYFGFAGVAADGTTLVNVTGANTHSSQHYVAASGVTIPSSFTVYTAFVSGHAGTGSSGNSSTFDSPYQAHTNVRYIRPLILVNYSAAAGTTEIDNFILEDIGANPAATVGATWGTDVDNLPTNLSGLSGTEGIENDLVNLSISGQTFGLTGAGSTSYTVSQGNVGLSGVSNNADQTSANTAAAIAGQGALATQGSVALGSQVTGTLGQGSGGTGLTSTSTLQNANVNLSISGQTFGLTGAGATTYTVSQGNVGLSGVSNNADQTSANTAAAIAGQGTLATSNTVNLATTSAGGVSGVLPVANTEAEVNTIDAGDSVNQLLGANKLEGPTFGAGTLVISGTSIKKTSGASWNAGYHSDESYVGGMYVTATVSVLGDAIMFGLSDAPQSGTLGSYQSIDYAIYQTQSNTVAVYESGTSRGTQSSSLAVGDQLTVVYDGSRVKYYKNATLLRTVVVENTNQMYASWSFYDQNSELRNISYGPVGSTRWGDIAGANVPANNADVTSANTAAAIAGQGTLATSNSVALGSQVTGTLGQGSGGTGLTSTSTLQNANVNLSISGQTFGLTGAGATSYTVSQGNVGLSGVSNNADQTSANTAAAISGQGALATQSSVTQNQTPIHMRGNLIDSSSWSGASATTPWSDNGGEGQNDMIIGTGPKGNSQVLWRGVSAGTSSANGGWTVDSNVWVPDNTKTYRCVVPIMRPSSTGTGTAYWGIEGNTVCNLNTTTTNSNPYWITRSRSSMVQNRWYLFVGYVYPYNTTGWSHTGSGLYDMATGQYVASGTNYNWSSAPGTVYTRSYMYYSSSTADQQYFAAPIVHLVDGTEPSLSSFFTDTAYVNTTLSLGTSGTTLQLNNGGGNTTLAQGNVGLSGVSNNADQTSANTAAAISGQGTLATSNSVALGSQVTGTLAVGNAATGLRNSGVNVSLSGTTLGMSGAGATTYTMAQGNVGLSGVSNNADQTSANTAAAISGQGSLATQSSATWSTQVTGTGKPANNADVTSANTAAAISGQGTLATQNSVTTSQVPASTLNTNITTVRVSGSTTHNWSITNDGSTTSYNPNIGTQTATFKWYNGAGTLLKTKTVTTTLQTGTQDGDVSYGGDSGVTMSPSTAPQGIISSTITCTYNGVEASVSIFVIDMSGWTFKGG